MISCKRHRYQGPRPLGRRGAARLLTLCVVPTLTASACQPQDTAEMTLPGVEQPSEPVLRRTVRPAETAPPQQQVTPSLPDGPFEVLVTVGGRELAGRQQFVVVAERLEPGRAILRALDQTEIAIAYRVADTAYALRAETGDTIAVDAESGLVRGALRKNLVLRRADVPLIAFLRDGGNAPLRMSVGRQLQIAQIADERVLEGEHRGLRTYRVPVRVIVAGQSRTIMPGEEETFDTSGGPVTVHVVESGQQEPFGDDAARARARMEGPPFYHQIVVYRR